MTPDQLRRYRIAMDMTQEELAKKLGVDRMTILRYENGKTHIPKVSERYIIEVLLRERGLKP